MLEFSTRFSLAQLRAATNTYLDTLLDIIKPFGDAHLTFEPQDPNANDPYAKAGEENIAWSLGHLILHVTATLEEGAAFSSLLARGVKIPQGVRLRYEADWQTVTTRAQVVQRIEESRRICLSYLDTWPDSPQLDVYRELTEQGRARWGDLNAPASYLNSLSHFDGHLAQIRDAAEQAKAAIPA